MTVLPSVLTPKNRWRPLPLIALLTLAILVISVISLVSGELIIFQNLFYFPIILACVYYVKRGFVFSVILACSYFFLMLIFSQDPVVLQGAAIRVLFFILVAGVITYLSIVRIRTEESERRYRLLIENSHDVIYTLDLQGVITFASPSWKQLLGQNNDAVVGHRFQEFVHPDDIPRCEKFLASALEARGSLPGIEYRIRNVDGEWKWHNTNGAPIINADGTCTSVVGIASDITESKQAEEETQRERAFFDQLVETAPEGIAIADTQSRIMRVNAEFLRMFGYGADEVVGQCLDDLVAPPALQEEARELTKSTGQGGEILLETVRRRKDGTLVDVSLIGAPILIAGKQEALYAIYRDITGRKQAEAQLRQSQKMEAIGQLAGGVAHDFNNLLTGILGNIALMHSSLPPADPLLENLNAAETAARQAADLTKGLLTFSRSAMVLPVSMNITVALNATLVLLKQSLPATMEIVRDYEQTAWNVLLDRSQMTQVMLNLAVNARDAMKGRGTLTIRTRNVTIDTSYVHEHLYARTGEFVHLSVSDTGTGISSEVMQHLFEPFYTTKPVGSGTGLGLSIVYGAVKQAGGWITADSGPGAGKTTPQIGQPRSGRNTPRIERTSSGAVFDIYLPRCLEEPVQSVTPSHLSVNTGSGTVLVVEDEPIVCTVTQALLSRSGYTVLTAPDGASALNVLREHPTDIGLILLDMTMPGMTTGEIVQVIRTIDTHLPVLLTSGSTSNDTIKQMLDEGSVQGFLGKPYDLHQLLEKIQQLLHGG